MTFTRILAVIIVFCSTSFYATAQDHRDTSSSARRAPQQEHTGTVQGRLLDAQNNPVAYATVTLLRPDSSVVNGDLTKDDGSFKVTPTGTGTFMLRINVIGYNRRIIGNISITEEAPLKDLGKITISQTTQTLKTVEVTGERALMEMKVDKKVFNVEKNITTAGGSASDVLQNVPSVSVDVDGNVSLRGKGNVTLLIDGKPATLLGTDVASALQSLPAASIESVEVITNPSAKYDAQGMTGIINIITKRDNRIGINGTATAGVGTHEKYNGSFAINLRTKKLNVFLNSSYRLSNNFNDVYTRRLDKLDADTSNTVEHGKRHFGGFFNTVGATYDFDKNNSLTLSENINLMDFGYSSNSYYEAYNPNETSPLSRLHRYSSFSGSPFSVSTSLDYKRKFKKQGEELSVDATYSATTMKRQQNYNTEYKDGAGAVIDSISSRQNAPGTGSNSTFNAWADYTDPLFTKNGKLGLGWKSQFYWFSSENSPIVDTNGRTAVTDYSLLALYSYSQQIHAAYVNWNDQYGKFTYQVGLRGEYAAYSGTDKALSNGNYKNDFLSLFPSAFVSYQLPKQQSIYLNYSRRTNRPNFFQLIPFRDISNPAVVTTGNPDLVPEFTHNVEFSYNKQTDKGNNYILSAYYQYTKNLIERVNDSIDPTGIIYIIPKNLSSATTYGLEATSHVNILPMWDATLNFNFFQNVIVGGPNVREAADQSGFSWFGKVNTTLRLPMGFSLQLNGNYESPKLIAQATLKETYWVDAAIRKNLWKNKATIVLNVSDIFNTHKYSTYYDLPIYTETLSRYRETRVGNITFTYRFGKSDVGGKAGAAAAPGQQGKRKSQSKENITPTEKDRENNLKQSDDDQGGQGAPPAGGNGNNNGGGRQQGR